MVKKIGSYGLEWKTWRLNAMCRSTCSKWLNNLCHKFMKVMKIVSCYRMIVMAHFFKQVPNCFSSLKCQMWGVEWTNDFVLYLHPQTKLVRFIGEIMYLSKLEWNHLNWSHNLNFFLHLLNLPKFIPMILKAIWHLLIPTWYMKMKLTLIPISNSYVQIQRNSILVLDMYI